MTHITINGVSLLVYLRGPAGPVEPEDAREDYTKTAPRAPRVVRVTRYRGNASGCRSGRGKSIYRREL